jgi:hypothetical protein
VLALLMVSACSDEIVSQAVTDGEEFTVSFGMEIPTRDDGATRAFGVDLDPSKASIVLLSFDENHLLTNVYQGHYEGVDGKKVKYSVTLKSSSEKRAFHIIVNHNDLDIDAIQYGLESDVLNSDQMIVGDEADVYWARIEMDRVDETTATTKLSDVKLIRNYAKLTLKFDEAVTNLTDDVAWGIMGIPTKGSVAPYIFGQTFADYFVGSDSQSSYSELFDQGYKGNVPRTAANAATFYDLDSADEANKIKWKHINEPIYLYENEGSSESSLWKKTAILLRGKFNGSDDYSYYRVSLVDPTRNYELLNVLRNIVYKITINEVKNVGASSPQSAYNLPSSSNISGSTETSTYQSVNIGEEVLRVEYMRKYILYPQEFTMMTRYVKDAIKDIDADGYYKADNSQLMLTSAAVYDVNGTVPAFVGSRDDGFSISSEWDGNDTLNNYHNFCFKSNTPLAGEKAVSSKVRVTVKDNRALYRDVEFILRERYKMRNIELYKDIDNNPDDENNCFTLTVEIPASMPQELFPLDFTFETYPPCVYPNAAKSIMAVNGVHSSIFTDLANATTSFHYHRTVSWTNFNNKLEKDGSGGFVEKDGYKRISFFFKINKTILDELYETGSISSKNIRFGVYCNSFSPTPDDDLEKSTASILEATYLFSSDDDGNYKLE